MECTNPQLNRTWQYAIYALLSFVSLIFIIILIPSSGTYFRRFFGDLNAIIVIVITSVVGAAALWVLQNKYDFVIFMGKGTLRGLALSAALATVLALASIIADIIFRYPKDINVPVPQALMFYPSVGFVAEIIFFVLPLALLLIILNPIGGWIGRERLVWLCILLVAILEPSFQVLFERNVFTWRSVYTWSHVFAIAFIQLYIFRRFDFVSMYSFRLIYYAYWHILWGVIRLEVLF